MNEEMLIELEELASAMMPLDQISKIIGIPYGEMMQELEDTESDIYRRYHRGRLKTIAANNQKIISLAKQGSGPAQMLVKKMEMDSRMEEIHHAYK